MELMSQSGNAILVFTLIHFTLGRSFSVLFAVINHMPLLLYCPLALAFDFVQIPIYGLILEGSTNRFFAFRWFSRKRDRFLVSLDRRPLLKKIMSLGDIGLILLSALPVRGFGILSASVLCFFLKKERMRGTILLMIGSLIGIFIVTGIAKGVFGMAGLFK